MSNELMPLHQYRNVIFDLDGTLVRSNDAHAHAFMDAFEANGIHHIDFNGIRKMIGMNGQSLLCHMLDEDLYQEKREKIESDRLQIFEERYMEQVEANPGTLPLLELLKTHGTRVAVASASPKKVVERYIQKLGIQHLLEGYTTDEDVIEGKPSPLAIEICCEKFGFLPQETLMVGDSPYDVIAAHEFSIPTLGVLTGGYSREELLKTGASAVYEDLDELYRSYQETLLSK